MPVNKNFYHTINYLSTRGLEGGEISDIVDYASFVDAGKTINDVGGAELANNFISNLMNRTGFFINTHRSYKGQYTDLFKGTIGYGNTVQMVMDGFYDTQAAVFADLPTDGEAVDQYVINRPSTHVRYYTDTNAYSIPVTITRDQLRKAWSTPDEMDSFIRNVVGAVLNASEYHREIARINAVNSQIATCVGQTGCPANVVNLAAGLNAMGLYVANNDSKDVFIEGLNKILATNAEAVRYMVSTIRHYSRAVESPSNLYNTEGITTFTPASGKRLYLLDRFAKSADALIYQNAFNPEYNRLNDYVTVNYWQNAEDDSFISAESNYLSKGQESKVSWQGTQVIGVLFDEYAVAEYLRTQTMDATPYNARGKYWNYWLNVESELINNPFANTIVFTFDNYQTA